MSEHYRQRLRQLQSLLEPGMRRMLFLSFLLHLIVPVILSGVLKITHKTPQVPVYRVNLVNKPVKDPRAGRPDAAPKQTKKKAIPAKPVKKIAAKKVEPKKPPVKKAPVAKAVPDKAAQEKAAREAQQAREAAIKEMEAKKALEDKIARLKAQAAQIGKPVEAPVGEPDGTGEEIGTKDTRYVEGFIKEHWRLSQYQLQNLDLEAEVSVIYSAEGKLRNWEFVEKSGNRIFDDSITRAILNSKQLDYSLPSEGTFEIIFNLKDFQNR